MANRNEHLHKAKKKKKDDLNRLYQNLGKRYTADQIIQILQEKWLKKING